MAIRLVFAHEGDQVRLVARQRVDMMTPPSDPLSPAEGAPGLWAEVRDTEGRTLHRRDLPDVLGPGVEVFEPDPARSASRADVERPPGAFAVLVPEIPEADHLALLAATHPTGTQLAPPAAREVLRVSLDG